MSVHERIARLVEVQMKRAELSGTIPAPLIPSREHLDARYRPDTRGFVALPSGGRKRAIRAGS